MRIKGLSDDLDKKALLTKEAKSHKLYRTFLEVITDDMCELADR